MVKRATLYLSCLCGCLLSILGMAAESNISITGNVKERTCNVAAGSEDFTVNLLSNSSSLFNQVGDHSPAVSFSIALTNCSTSVTGVRVGFTGTTAPQNSDLLRLDSIPASATGLAIEVLDSTRQVVALNASSSELSLISIIPGQDKTLNFYGRLTAIQLPVTPGRISASATYTLEFQ